MIYIERLAEREPDTLRDIIRDSDFGVDIVKMAMSRPYNEWGDALADMLADLDGECQDVLDELTLCPHCGGSGGGYMGEVTPDSWCPHCRGTGKRR